MGVGPSLGFVDRAVTELALGANDTLPRLEGVAAAAGSLTFAPATITFLALPEAGNSACR